MDTQLESDISTTPSSNFLQIPQNDLSQVYPLRDTTSSYSRSTASSLAKYKVAILLFSSIVFFSTSDYYFSVHRYRHHELTVKLSNYH